MEVNLSNIKKVVINFKNLEELYRNLYYEYYNEIKSVDNEWNNTYERRLMANIEKEKKDMSLLCDDIYDITSLYNLIYEKYSVIGNKISINIEQEDSISKQIDICINRLRKIINSCNKVDISDFSEYQITILNNTSNKVITILNKLIEIKNNISYLFGLIREIETDISKKIEKIKLIMVQETDISNCIEQ